MDWTRAGRAVVRGVGAALVGGVIGALLTRGLMRLIVLVAEGEPSFTWTGLAFIAVFYVLFLTPGAIALAWSLARWPVVVPLFVAMAAVYALQALIVVRLARSGRRDRQGEPAAALV